MATPEGQVSMTDFHTHITRSSGQLSMSEMRTRYAGSGDIKFSDLRKTEAFTFTVGRYEEAGNKFGPGFVLWGYANTLLYNTGTGVSPAENNTKVQFAANSFLVRVTSFGGTSEAVIELYNTSGTPDSATITNGYRGDNVTRIVTANTNRTIVSASETGTQFTYAVPEANGTVISCLIKF